MLIKMFNESDGKCFALMCDGCLALNDCEIGCGTYRCKWYKPMDCKDWIRLDTRNMARMFAPEEFGERMREDYVEKNKRKRTDYNGVRGY